MKNRFRMLQVSMMFFSAVTEHSVVFSEHFINFPVENTLQTTVAIKAASRCEKSSGLRAYLVIAHPEIF